MKEISLGNIKVSTGSDKVFVIAELSANHNHDIEIAKRTIQAAKKTGADAIKIQTYTADTLTINVKNKYFTIEGGTLWDGKNLYELYQEAHTPWEWHKELQQVAYNEGLIFFSTPFDFTAVDFLEELEVPVYKIASFEIFDIPLIEYTASKGKPMIISTGMATFENIHEAVEACRRKNNDQIILLKCTSSYPAPMEEANLKTIHDLQKKFSVVSGLSDHTLGITAPIVAVSLGAKVIEKHFILDRNQGGPDSSFSLNPIEFKQMVDAVREAEKAVGKITYEISEKVSNNKQFARSLFVVEDISAGEKFTSKNVRSIRPGYGLHPRHYSEILGKTSRSAIERGTPLSWDLLC